MVVFRPTTLPRASQISSLTEAAVALAVVVLTAAVAVVVAVVRVNVSLR